MKNSIKVERAKANYTQEQLALKIGVSRQTINAIEQGKYNPSIILALKIARIFDASVDSVFELEAED